MKQAGLWWNAPSAWVRVARRTEAKAKENIKEAIATWMMAEDVKAILALPPDNQAILVTV